MRKETIEFQGIQYYRFPDSPHKHLERYYWPSRTERKKGREVLHREIWKAVHGPIPDGCLIHHKDGNWLNNDPSNFECLTRKEHGERHPHGCSDWLGEHLARIREQATEWHRSEEGRAWHREHGKKSWEGRKAVSRICVYCHHRFTTLAARKNVRFCSSACAQRWQTLHGRTGLDRICAICGAEFRTSKYRPALTCGHKCGAALRQRQKEEPIDANRQT